MNLVSDVGYVCALDTILKVSSTWLLLTCPHDMSDTLASVSANDDSNLNNSSVNSTVGERLENEANGKSEQESSEPVNGSGSDVLLVDWDGPDDPLNPKKSVNRIIRKVSN